MFGIGPPPCKEGLQGAPISLREVRYLGADIDDALTVSEEPISERLPAPRRKRRAGTEASPRRGSARGTPNFQGYGARQSWPATENENRLKSDLASVCENGRPPASQLFQRVRSVPQAAG